MKKFRLSLTSGRQILTINLFWIYLIISQKSHDNLSKEDIVKATSLMDLNVSVETFEDNIKTIGIEDEIFIFKVYISQTVNYF